MTDVATVVALTDGDAVLARHLDRLREGGVRVLATARAQELLALAARGRTTAIIARTTLLNERAGEVIRECRSVRSNPRIILSTRDDDTVSRYTGAADAVLVEPYDFEALERAMLGGEPEADRRVGNRALAPDPPVDPLDVVAARRLVEYARRLTELERDRDQILTAGLEMFREALDADRASIMLKTDGGRRIEVVRRTGFPTEASGPIEMALGEEFAGVVSESGQPLLVPSVKATFPHHLLHAYRSDSFIIVPLADRQTILGVVNVTERRDGRPYRAEDLAIARHLAAQLALNLSNATLVRDLSEMAIIDPLTGLYNRRYFDRQFTLELERARRYGRELTLALLDIDSFKALNDQNGYITGDEILKQVGALIRRNFREVDIVTRWGGDEFAVMMPETGRTRMGMPATERSHHHFVERVRQTVEKSDAWKRFPRLIGRVTLSAGVATLPTDASDGEDLFIKANRALAKAKRSGNNRVCLASQLDATVAD